MSRSNRRCRECGCTEARACTVAGVPCMWIGEDLCSACALEPFLASAAGLMWVQLAVKEIVRQLDRGQMPEIRRPARDGSGKESRHVAEVC